MRAMAFISMKVQQILAEIKILNNIVSNHQVAGFYRIYMRMILQSRIIIISIPQGQILSIGKERHMQILRLSGQQAVLMLIRFPWIHYTCQKQTFIACRLLFTRLEHLWQKYHLI